MRYKKHKPFRLSGQDIPDRLKSIPQAPKALFFMGNLSLLDRPVVAVVGSRKNTPYGKQVTIQLASELSVAGIGIISGLALGIDAVAHSSCLEAGGKTIAVLPTSLDTIYPASHLHLAQQILDSNGLIISEYKDQSEVYKPNFVKRNRLISGLSNAVVVVEAAKKSGSLHTAKFALKQNKPLFAVPGPINAPQSGGTNQLIHDKKAQLLLGSQDVFKVLDFSPKQAKAVELELNSGSEKQVYNYLKQGPQRQDTIQKKLNLETQECSEILTMLEISGVVSSDHTGLWQIKQ